MQDLYMSNLITAEEVKQKRQKITEDEPMKKDLSHTASYYYKLKIPDADLKDYREVNVCRVAFLNILGLSRNRLRSTQLMLNTSLKKSTRNPLEQTNAKSDSNKDMFVPEQLENLIMAQIDSYPLSETYSVKKMHRNFLRCYRINIPYNVYWMVFHSKFNISQFEPKYTCMPTFDTFYETLHMFGLVDFSTDL